MPFLGVFSGRSRVRARFEARCAYLFSPVLHFSLDGRVAFCEGATEDALTPRWYPHLFCVTASDGELRVGNETLARQYVRHGRHLCHYLPLAVAFALYDSRKGVLLLGGSGGKKCFVEQTEEGVWFSSVSHLLRAPVAVDLARFRVE